MTGNDPITMVMEDLEKDPKFIHELSAIIGERLRTKPASLLQTRGNNTIEESSNEQIRDEDSHRIGKTCMILLYFDYNFRLVLINFE